MAADLPLRPLIWVLKGVRAGDTAQAMDLALQLSGRVEGKQLAFNASHNIPNWLMGDRISQLTRDTQKLLHPPWPDFVVATGRRTAPVALWIKKQSAGKTKLVHIGRPRMALSHFDLVLTTPQYGLPEGDNVVVMPLPFVISKETAHDQLQLFHSIWSHLPRPWILGVIGGGKFPILMDDQALVGFGSALNRRALQLGGSVILLDSPRSRKGAIAIVDRQLSVPHWAFKRGEGSNPYQPALKLGDELCVTSDSVSMVAELLDSGKPTWIYKLKSSPFTLKWSAKVGLGAHLANSGVIHPPRDVDGFMSKLLQQGIVGDLAGGVSPQRTFSTSDERNSTVSRVLTLLQT